MHNLLQTLKLGGSALAIAAAFSSAAAAQQASDTSMETVTVTGTSIRGVAPVGSNVITVDQKAIQQSGAVNMEQLLNTVTAISTANAPPQGVNNNSYFAPQIHQLAGSISNSTLAVVDGMRFVGAGGDTLADPNILPTAAIERVEVLADGASSIYGSDAVSGVVNFITRKDYEGLELNVQTGFADSYNTTTGSFLWGTRWNKGSVMVAGGYEFDSNLPGDSRRITSMGDFQSLGGNNYDNVYGCPTAAIVGPTVNGVGTVYLSPSATTPVTTGSINSLGQTTKNCNIQPYGDTLPQSVRQNALMKVNQDITDRLSASFMLDVNDLAVTYRSQPGQITANSRVYGPGYTNTVGNCASVNPLTGCFNTGQINPFFQAPAGAPTLNTEQVSWVDLMGRGTNGTDFGRNITNEQAMYGQFALTYKISDDWQAKFTDAAGWDGYRGKSINTFCGSCATLALNGTAQANGSATTTDVAGASVIATQSLTAANALDVWDPAGASNKTNAIVQRQLYSNFSQSDADNTINQARLEVDGPAFSLPAGDLKVAFGGEYVNYHLYSFSSGSNGTGQINNGATVSLFRSRRDVMSGYGEANIPLISPEMNIPLVEKVSIDISARYDKYSDVGPTFNPKYAIDWTVTDDIKFRGNYSTSFVAVPVGISGDQSLGGRYSGGGASIAPLSPTPVANFPGLALVPGCAGVTTCQLGGTNNPGLIRQYGSALANAKPQEGNGVNFGFDFTPTFIPGLTVNATYFDQNYKGGITAPNHTQIVNTPSAYHLLTICPNGCTQAQIDDFTRVPEGGAVAGQLPPTIYFLENHDENNVLDLHIEGIDLSANYAIDTDYGQFHLADGMTVFTDFKEGLLGGTEFNVLGTSAFNSTFPSVAMQSRLNLGWTNDVLDIDTFMNWTSAYRNIGATATHPPTADANGALVVGGDHVNANITFDLHVAYNFPGGLFSGDQLYVDMKNIFNKQPPFYNYAVPSNSNSSNGINTFVSNPIGRLISLGLRADF
jgi:iron complex outermembrane receptor protein